LQEGPLDSDVADTGLRHIRRFVRYQKPAILTLAALGPFSAPFV
jgi:hypothetical protein